MATIRQRRSGKWQAMVRRRGQPPASRSFLNRLDAERWARQIEAEIDRGVFVDRSPAERTTVAELIDRYLAEVTPHKRSADREKRRLLVLRKQFGSVAPTALQAKHIAAYRDERLSKGTAGGTVVKEMNSLSHLLDVAIKDWSLPLASNPVRLVRKPKQAPGRTRRLLPGEEAALLAACRTLSVETAVRSIRCVPDISPLPMGLQYSSFVIAQREGT